jgi:hypothetical protein
MSDPGMAEIGVAGLALLNDGDSLPLIAKACERFPSEDAEMLAVSALPYDDVRVNTLFSRFIPDSMLLDKVRKEWQSRISSQPSPGKE